MRFHHWTYVCLLMLILVLAFHRSPVETRREAPVVSQQTGPEVSAFPADPRDPSPEEVKQAITGVFGTVVSLPAQNAEFLSADFNGDGSSDLAVVVVLKPQAKKFLANEVANWSLQDVLSVEIPPPHAATYTYRTNTRKPEIRTGQLLAVIHGDGPDGWRNPEARQAYLLVHAAGGHLSVVPISELERQGTPVPRMSANPARAVVEIVAGREVAIYWTGAQYAATDIAKPVTQLARK